MLDEFGTWDLAALVFCLGLWGAYNALFDGRYRRPNSINARMIFLREAWILQLMARDNRVIDGVLIGHSISSATFFASTTIILVAGLLGVLGSAEMVHNTTMSLSMLLQPTSLALFEVKILFLIGIFVYAFFKFTWAIRQFNYFLAIIGGAPTPTEPQLDRLRAKRMAVVLSHAAWQVNAGLRAYYVSLAALGWFLHPLVFMAMTVLVFGVLAHRQLMSPSARAIGDHVKCLPTAPDRDPSD